MKNFLTALSILLSGLIAAGQVHNHSNMNVTNDQSKIKMIPPSLNMETFKVLGKCEECKARIEKTAMAKGAVKATWDLKTQILAVAFDPSNTNKEALSKQLASVGHDTEMFKATMEAYENLPGCCHYKRAE